MHRKRHQIFLFVAIALVSCAAHAEEAGSRLKDALKLKIAEHLKDEKSYSSLDKITSPGTYDFELKIGKDIRAYKVHVPESYSGGKEMPLVLALHGGGGDMDFMARDDLYGLISASERDGYIVAFPNGYSKLRSGKFATWNAGNCCGDARDSKSDDVGFIKAVFRDIEDKLNINTGRVYAIGMSNGGMMAYQLACDAPELFAAIASVAGTDNTINCNPSQPVPVLHIHAEDDTHVLFNGGAGKDVFKDQSKVTEFTSVPDTFAKWVRLDRCSDSPQRVLKIDGAYCDELDRCAGGVRVKLCVTKDGGHSWPGAKTRMGKASSSNAISANDQIWRFFEELYKKKN